jgi:hypothetical protein
MARRFTLIHPRESPWEHVLKPLNMGVNQLTEALAVDAVRLERDTERPGWGSLLTAPDTLHDTSGTTPKLG